MNRREMILTTIGIATGSDALAKLANSQEVTSRQIHIEELDLNLGRIDDTRFLVLEKPNCFILHISRNPWSVEVIQTNLIHGKLQNDLFIPFAGVCWLNKQPLCFPSSLNSLPISIVHNEIWDTISPKGLIVLPKKIRSVMENQTDVTIHPVILYHREGGTTEMPSTCYRRYIANA